MNKAMEIIDVAAEDQGEETFKALEIVGQQSALADQFSEGWDHFLKCIDFKHTFLDARAIAWMNEVSLKESAIKVKLEKINEL